MTLDDIGLTFIQNAGYNELAEANNIILLYPQIVKSLVLPTNPMGCWDWWGYTDYLLPAASTRYATKDGT
jgi:hypothetical protein